jgi:two-component system chemotaxis response regulator CheY
MSKHILTVDDSPSMRKMVALTLEKAGYTVSEAEDGDVGLQMALDTQFDAIITDQNMPNMDGISLVREVKMIPSYESVPIIVLSSDSSAILKQEARGAGALGWMVKPFTEENLLAAMKRLVG